MNPILTRADGTPIDRPEPLPENPSIDEQIAYLRAKNAYHDEVTDVANAAFIDAFMRLVW